jgi:phage regulator Rha-like protein
MGKQEITEYLDKVKDWRSKKEIAEAIGVNKSNICKSIKAIEHDFLIKEIRVDNGRLIKLFKSKNE